MLEAALTNQRRKLLLFIVSLGSLKRIDLLLTLLFCFIMSGKIAGAGFPFDGRIRIAAAEFSGSVLHCARASFALFDDWMAGAAIIAASRFGHEGAFRSRLHRFANHGNHPLSYTICIFLRFGKRVRIITGKFLLSSIINFFPI